MIRFFRFLAFFLLILKTAFDAALALAPSPFWEGAREMSRDIDRPGVFAGDGSSAEKSSLLKADEFASKARRAGRDLPLVMSSYKQKSFSDDFLGRGFNVTTGVGVATAAVLGLAVGALMVNPVLGFTVFMAGALLLPLIFNLLK